MKNLFKKTSSDQAAFFRLKNQKHEEGLKKSHKHIKEQVAIPLGRTLAQRSPCLPEEGCKEFSPIQEVETQYVNMLRETEVELQIHIQPHYIDSENELIDDEISDIRAEQEKLANDLRIASGELDLCDKSYLKKDKRYPFYIRPLLFGVMLLDMLLSASALENAGISKGVAYGIGLILGIGILFLSERLPQIIEKGRTILQKRIIAISIFLVCFILFYALGKLRVLGYSEGVFQGSQGVKPIYFAAMNLFMMLIVVIVSYFTRLNPKERAIVDTYKTNKKDVTVLASRIKNNKEAIKKLKAQKAKQELTRRQITHYAEYLENLIQGYFEESVRAFQSINTRYRIDGKTPVFFKKHVPQLPKMRIKKTQGSILKNTLLALLFASLLSCSDSQAPEQIISVLEDITEQDFIAHPDDKTLTGKFGLEKDLWQGAGFRYGRLSSLEQSSRYQLLLPEEQSLLGNTLQRREKVDCFLKDVRKLLQTPKDSVEYHQSSLWIPIIEEVKTLASLKAPATLYIFSDLAENSPLFSIENATDLQQLDNDSKTVEQRFLSQAEELEANGIKVVVIYQPKNIEQDRAFKQWKVLYTSLFKTLDIPITFIANLNTNSYE